MFVDEFDLAFDIAAQARSVTFGSELCRALAHRGDVFQFKCHMILGFMQLGIHLKTVLQIAREHVIARILHHNVLFAGENRLVRNGRAAILGIHARC